MKKIFGLALVSVSLILTGCSNSSKTNMTENTENKAIEETTKPDTHTAKNSLDYKGTYKGATPCADCDSIMVTIKLGDNDYTKTSEYFKNKKSTLKDEEKGTYTWNNEGTIINLEGVKDAPGKYIVQENKLQQLDMDGNKITGQWADKYILKKQ